MTGEGEFHDAAGAAFKAALDQLAAHLRPLQDSVVEYSRSMAAAGFTQEAASDMACEYHRLLLALVAQKLLGH